MIIIKIIDDNHLYLLYKIRDKNTPNYTFHESLLILIKIIVF